MKKRKAPNSNRSNRRRSNHDRISFRTVLITFVCGGLVLAGIFLAASQHFSAMNVGMENSKLRKQLEDFKAENRRLTLAKEVAMSPAQITKLAREIGFDTPQPTEVAAVKSVEKAAEQPTEEQATVELASVKESPIEKRDRIIKTETASLTKNVSTEKQPEVKIIKTVETRSAATKAKPAPKKTNPEAEKVVVVKDGSSRPRVITVAKLR
jgi:hypothetical protein